MSIQTLIFMIGQYINLVVFYLRIFFVKRRKRTHFRKYKNRALMSGKLYEFSALRIGAGGLLFCLSNSMQVYALVVISPTMYQMLLSCVVVFTPLISRVVLNKKIYKHTLVGIVCTVIALCSICASSFLLERTTPDKHDAQGWELFFNYVVMSIGLITCSIHRVYEEWLLTKIETSSFRFVGIEGVYGVISLTIVHVLFAAINKIHGSNMFNIGAAVNKVLSSPSLIITSLLLLISVTFYDMSGIVIVRKVSATYRVVNDMLRTIIIWIVEIFLYDLQGTIDDVWLYVGVSIWRLLSYFLLIFGNILINELIDINFCGLDKYFGKYNDNKLDDSIVSESDEFSIMKS